MQNVAAWEWQKDGSAERVWKEVNEKGWTLVRWPEAAAQTERDPNGFCAELLGRPPVLHRFAKLQVVAGVDKGYEQTKGPADLHTDQHPYLPAQIQVLACVKPASEGGESGRSRQVSKGAIPLPQRALLDRQSEPGCALKVAPMDGGERKGKPSTPAAPAANAAGPVQEGLTGPQQSLATRIKLEYERNCFQQAEVDARQRLWRLQEAVGKTIRAVERLERDGSERLHQANPPVDHPD